MTHVPDLKKNLFSEGTFTRREMKTIEENDYANIYSNEKIATAIATRESNNLYLKQFQTVATHEANLKANGSLKLFDVE